MYFIAVLEHCLVFSRLRMYPIWSLVQVHKAILVLKNAFFCIISEQIKMFVIYEIFHSKVVKLRLLS